MGELFVSLCVMAKGGQVLRNQSPNGAVDLVLRLGMELYPIDVKVASVGKGGRNKTECWAINSGIVPSWVYPVMVIPEGGLDFQQWKARWVLASGQTMRVREKSWRCPPGLENFWSKSFSLFDYTNETTPDRGF